MRITLTQKTQGIPTSSGIGITIVYAAAAAPRVQGVEYTETTETNLRQPSREYQP
jgi:hypothetical protein